MTPADVMQGSQATYDWWLGLIPSFMRQFGTPGSDASAPAEPSVATPLSGFAFPVDQVAKAALLTQQSLQALAPSLAAMLNAGGIPNLLSQWTTAAPAFTAAKPGDAATAAANAMQAMLASWTGLVSNAAGAVPSASSANGGAMPTPSLQAMTPSLQTMTQALSEMGSKLAGATPAEFDTAFDRTYGALGDAFGLGPARRLHAAWREAIAASVAQHDARNSHALLVQEALTQGFQRLLRALAEKADAGERIDSVFALLRLWAAKTEEVMHETLQSERGLAATAALTRSGLAYRRRMQDVAHVYAELLDMATRRELDDAYREIQALKRELRGLRATRADDGAPKQRKAADRATSSPRKRTKPPA